MASRSADTTPPPSHLPHSAATTVTTTTTASITTGPKKTPPPPKQQQQHEGKSFSCSDFLRRKEKEIVDRSMAYFELSLDRCLESSISSSVHATAAADAGATTAGAKRSGTTRSGARKHSGATTAAAAVVMEKRRVKRGREEDGDEGIGGDGDGVDAVVAVEKIEGGKVATGKAKKKKVNPKESPDDRSRFACPFAKHDPAKHRHVKTCCGPGWEDAHRVKEHVYRAHSLKNVCPRCFSRFEKSESLQAHQRADAPCGLRAKTWESIGEEQEKQLHARAKAHSSEEDKWRDMYRVIFPGEKVPSPYYENDDSVSDSAATRQEHMLQQFDFIRQQLPRVVRSHMEVYVHQMFEEFQNKANQKVVEIIQFVEASMVRTFQFGLDHSAPVTANLYPPNNNNKSTPSSPISATLLPYESPALTHSTPATTTTDTYTGPATASFPRITDIIGQLHSDPSYQDMCAMTHRDIIGDMMAGQLGGGGDLLEGACEGLSENDSAYFSNSSINAGTYPSTEGYAGSTASSMGVGFEGFEV
ncbi:hypothetical protein B0J18DRAFT_411241 [Chaetomium sp. MPI-SDFR-AT-0129]|nr:hypothetical protein B0J18DRAFT_411241 [Chaetomium sp. MPI-SDFR-AT-0129]